MKISHVTQVAVLMWAFAGAGRAQPTSNSPLSNHVLELDGKNSYVELPAGAFTNYSVVTVEGWVKWMQFRNYSRFFDFAVGGWQCQVINMDRRAGIHLGGYQGGRFG